LAALTYSPALRKAGATLSQLDSHINYARETIDPKKAQRPIDRQQKTQVDNAINDVHSTFGRITKVFNESTHTNSGILYRIEQSRYYKAQFDKNVQALRIGRLEGYQRYDEFVERRLGAAFDFIDRLGRRYERATNTISTLDENYLTMESTLIETGIRKIQQWGEFALLAVLVPYYFAHLLALIVQEQYMAPITVSLWTLFSAVAVYQKVPAYQKVEKLKYAALPVVIVAALVAGLYLKGVNYITYFRYPPNEQLKALKEPLEVENELLNVQKESKAIQMQLIKVQREFLDAQKKRDEGALPGRPPDFQE
jgi:Protein of unknown function (DUF3422)